MSVIKPILHDRRANCWLLPLYRKGYTQKQFTVNIMVNPSTHIMRCNKLIIFVGSYIHPQKKRFIERGNMVARLWMKVRSMNETVAKVNHTKQYTLPDIVKFWTDFWGFWLALICYTGSSWTSCSLFGLKLHNSNHVKIDDLRKT